MEGAGDGETTGGDVGEGDGASVSGAVEHARPNTAMPPSSPVASMDTKSLLGLVFAACAVAPITPRKAAASVLTLTVLGECKDPVSAYLWNITIW